MTENMVLYGKSPEYDIADAIYDIASSSDDDSCLGSYISMLIDIAGKYRISGNVWKGFIAWLIINDENPFSLSCEMNNAECGGLYSLALRDAAVIREMFNVPLENNDVFNIINDFQYSNNLECMNLAEIGVLSCTLAEKLEKAGDDKAFLDVITDFYSNHGVGSFGLNKAFYLDISNGLEFVPISDFDNAHLSDMWGYEIQKKQLTDNTEAFLDKKAANNVLLYGDSGTGKSTSIKAILNEYHSRGLRMIEVYKHQFSILPQLIEILRKRNYRFIIFMDDLSFEDFEIEYKFLKAVIEGGLEKRPDNVLIYATSNRRHLIKESFSDRSSDDDVHNNDTIQEKLSLSDRFGVTINFSKPLQKEYFEIVKYLANINEIDIDEQELINLARQWGLRHGGISGRVAHQFISNLLGKME